MRLIHRTIFLYFYVLAIVLMPNFVQANVLSNTLQNVTGFYISSASAITSKIASDVAQVKEFYKPLVLDTAQTSIDAFHVVASSANAVLDGFISIGNVAYESQYSVLSIASDGITSAALSSKDFVNDQRVAIVGKVQDYSKQLASAFRFVPELNSKPIDNYNLVGSINGIINEATNALGQAGYDGVYNLVNLNKKISDFVLVSYGSVLNITGDSIASTALSVKATAKNSFVGTSQTANVLFTKSISQTVDLFKTPSVLGNGLFDAYMDVVSITGDQIGSVTYNTVRVGEDVLAGFNNTTSDLLKSTKNTVVATISIPEIIGNSVLDYYGDVITITGDSIASVSIGASEFANNSLVEAGKFLSIDKSFADDIKSLAGVGSIWTSFIDKISTPLVPLFENTQSTNYQNVSNSERANRQKSTDTVTPNNQNSGLVSNILSAKNTPQINVIERIIERPYNLDLSGPIASLRSELLNLNTSTISYLKELMSRQESKVSDNNVRNSSSSSSGTVTSIDASGGTTGLIFSGGPITTSGTLTLGGVLAISNGGTGTTTAPSYGQVLLGNALGGYDLVATSSLGITSGATGVTSVDLSVPTGLSVTGGPITTSGTLALSLASGYNIPLTASTTEWSNAYSNRITSASSPLSISNNIISLSTAGDWTGTLDGQDGSYYLNASNLSNFGSPFYTYFSATTTDALAQGSTNKYYSTSLFNTDLATKTTSDLAEGSNLYYTDARVDSYINASTTIPKLYSTNIFTGANTFSSLSLGTLNGPLQANNGVISATSSIGVLYGGTGLSSAPSYGQVLLGNASGSYDLVATSSLGITATNYWSLSGSDIYNNTGTNVGVGSTTPWGQLSVNPNGITGPAFVVGSSTATNFVVTNGGNVGVGTSTPSELFSVAGSNKNILSVSENSGNGLLTISATGGSSQALSITPRSVSNTYFPVDGAGVLVQSNASNGLALISSGGLMLSGNGSNNMYINSSGNVGIGTSTPTTKFMINGVGSTATPSSSGTVQAFIGTGANNNVGLVIRAYSSSQSSPLQIWQAYNGTPVATMYRTGMLFLDDTGVLANSTGAGYATVNGYTAMLGNGGSGYGAGISSTAFNIGTGNLSSPYFTVVKSSQSVGVGTTTPYGQLSVNPNGVTGPAFVVGSSTATNFIITNGGRVGIGTSAPASMLNVKAAAFGDSWFSVTNPAGTQTASLISMSSPLGTGPDVKIGTGVDRLFLNPSILIFNAGTTQFTTSSFDMGGSSTTWTSIGSWKMTTSVANVDIFRGGVSLNTTIRPYSSSYSVLLSPEFGNVGVGTSTPWGRLSVGTGSGSTIPQFVVASSSSAIATSTSFIVDRFGNVGVASSTPWRQLSVVGTMAVNGLTASGATDQNVCINPNTKEITFGTSCIGSSERFKHDILTLESGQGLDLVNALRPVSFKYNNNDAESIGFIAEEVNLLEPRLVFYEEDGVTPKGVRYENFAPVVVKAIQELSLNLESIASTTLATPESSAFADSFFDAVYIRIASWLEDATNGIKNIFADKVSTKELCVGDTCVTEDMLRALLQNSGQPVTTQGGGSTNDSTSDSNSGDSTTTNNNDSGEDTGQDNTTSDNSGTSEGDTTGGGESVLGDSIGGDSVQTDTGSADNQEPTGEAPSGDTNTQSDSGGASESAPASE